MAVHPSLDRIHTDDDLEALLSRISCGDELALTRLYDVTSPRLYGLVLGITGDSAAAEETTLEVYFQVWRTASSYDSQRGGVLAWLINLARSRAIDWLRSRRARRSRLEEPIESAPHLRDAGLGPEAACLGGERARVVRSAMAELPVEQRQAIEMAYFHGMSHSEIAAQGGLPLGTVKSRIRLGMLGLREALDLYAGVS